MTAVYAWSDAYAVVWPRSGGPGPYRCGCNASYGQSCPGCDGTDADAREQARTRRTTTPQTTETTR